MVTTKLKTTALQVIFVSSIIFGVTSCDQKNDHDNDKNSDSIAAKTVTADVAEDQNDGKFNESEDEKNAKFLVKAAENDLQEIKLAKLAQEKSTNSDVKDFAKKMEAAHTKALADLNVLAAKKSISIPTDASKDANDLYEKMNEKSEKDFNKDYADKMVSAHKDAIDMFEKKSVESSDEDIRTWAASMLPELRKHLDHAIMVQEKCSKM